MNIEQRLVYALSGFLRDLKERESGQYWFGQLASWLDEERIDIGKLIAGKLEEFKPDDK